LINAENYLSGKTPNQANFEAAAELAMKEARPLEDNKYKVEMGKKSIVSALLQAYER